MLSNLTTEIPLEKNMDSLVCILYHSFDECGTSNVSHLGSIAPSLTGSRTNIAQSIPAISRLQNAPESFVSSNRSLLSSRGSIESQLAPSTGGKSTRSIRSLVSSVPLAMTQCYVQCGPQWRKYGFEYYCNGGMKMALTPLTDKCLYQLMQGLSECGGCCLTSDLGSEEMVKELAMVSIIINLLLFPSFVLIFANYLTSE